jgi:hypothetical protein
VGIPHFFENRYSKSNIKVIYPLLAGRQHFLTDRCAEILQEVAQNLIAEHPEAIESILGDIENLSSDISNFPQGKRANNLEIAITDYQILLSNWEPGSPGGVTTSLKPILCKD